MELIAEWTEKIAREIVPDEIDQAPFVAADFMKGGKSRKALLRRAKGGVFGGFGAGELAVLPWILQAIHNATPFLAGLLTSVTLDSSISSIKEIIAARRRHDQKTHATLGDTVRPQDTAIQCMDAMIHDLRKSGLSTTESERIVDRLIALLSEDPASAQALIQAIAEVK
jgi:hypothetical protein